MGPAVTVVVVVFGELPICAVKNCVANWQIGEEDGDRGSVVAVATRSNSALEIS